MASFRVFSSPYSKVDLAKMKQNKTTAKRKPNQLSLKEENKIKRNPSTIYPNLIAKGTEAGSQSLTDSPKWRPDAIVLKQLMLNSRLSGWIDFCFFPKRKLIPDVD